MRAISHQPSAISLLISLKADRLAKRLNSLANCSSIEDRDRVTVHLAAAGESEYRRPLRPSSSRRIGELQNTEFQCLDNCLGAIRYAQFGHDVLDVILGRAEAYDEVSGNFTITAPQLHDPENLQLARRQGFSKAGGLRENLAPPCAPPPHWPAGAEAWRPASGSIGDSPLETRRTASMISSCGASLST